MSDTVSLGEVDSVDWKIETSEIKLGDVIGRGAFGVVHASYWRHTPVAAKILFKDSQAADRELFRKETRIMATLHHPNIVQFLGYTRTTSEDCGPDSLTLVIEVRAVSTGL